ncbi:zinc-regulated transporter 1 [Lasiosphaeris hirsuta]|uniref:Zinc-regulated transporter 1 n=1 Tax=Lasiosphaeris hirsuta TaxID=260670 RepID=A0AA40EEA6_9PEZI|nr:zinc-regulated transporter 1 [Lasiosphaeris hirsuta]
MSWTGNNLAGAITGAAFDPHSVDLDSANLRDIICYVNAGGNQFDGRLGARISALFVILVTSSLTTLFPVIATRVPNLRIPLYVYLFARYFGAGVIIATAFIHLLDPAYAEIGPATCVGMMGSWALFSWPPAIAMTSVMLIFLLDFGAEWYVERTFDFGHEKIDVEGKVTKDSIPMTETIVGETKEAASNEGTSDNGTGENDTAGIGGSRPREDSQPAPCSHQYLHSADQGDIPLPSRANTGLSRAPTGLSRVATRVIAVAPPAQVSRAEIENGDALSGTAAATERAFREQILSFLILEFGVIFHSVIIGLNLGVIGEEFTTLYPVIVFHQAFEGLGIGARLSVIPFPKRMGWMPWALCLAYGFTTPIAIAVGVGLATQYDSESFTASVVSGVLDSISAGILLYTGLVELLARDFLFNKERTRDKGRITFMLVCLFLGTIIMALLGRWA